MIIDKIYANVRRMLKSVHCKRVVRYHSGECAFPIKTIYLFLPGFKIA